MTGPVILLLVMSAVVMMAVVSETARRQDRISMDNAFHVARSAITALEDGLRNEARQRGLRQAREALAGAGQPYWVSEIARPASSATPEITSAFMLDGANRLVHAVVDRERLDDPNTVDLAAVTEGGLGLLLERARAGSASDSDAASGLLKLDGRVHVVAATLLARGPSAGTEASTASAPVLVLARGLDQPLLTRIGADFLLRGLSIGGARGDVPLASLPLSGIDGSQLAELTWELDLAGRAQINDLIPLLTVAWLVMIGLAWVFAQRALRVTVKLERGRNLEHEKAILVESERTLRLSEARYRNLFERSPISILEQDWSGVKEMIERLRRSGFRDLRRTIKDYLKEDSGALASIRILDVNSTTLEVYRSTDKEACIQGLQERLAESVPEGADEVLAALAEGQIRIATEISEKALDGSELVVRRLVQIPEEHKESWSRVLVTVEDITERKATEAQLLQAQKMEAVGQLTGGIAHDFNNLMTVIQGNIELMREDLDADSDAETIELLDDALSAARDGSELADRLLAFSRKQTLNPTRIDMNDLLVDFSRLLRRSLGQDIEVRIEQGKDVSPIFADRSQLENALLNLAVNAGHAMPEGGILTLETSNRRIESHESDDFADVGPGDYAMIKVSDTGVGMPPEVLEHVLEPFYTTKESGVGTGLGLSMVHGFAKQSGGGIRITSEVGTGTDISVLLPVAPADARELEQGDDSDALPRGSETVLVAEDEPRIRKFAVRCLKDLGYQVLEAENATEVLEILHGGASVDVLFSDIVMPGGMTGRELAKAVAEAYPGLKVQLTTGFSKGAGGKVSDDDKQYPVLKKPYSKAQLAQRIREALDGDN